MFLIRRFSKEKTFQEKNFLSQHYFATRVFYLKRGIWRKCRSTICKIEINITCHTNKYSESILGISKKNEKFTSCNKIFRI